MKIIKPSVEILSPIDGDYVLRHIERCARVCYKSEGKIAEGSAEKFLAGIIKRGHESVLEHFSFTVKFICDRGVSHEIVRHRLASYSQESTRYCNYSDDVFGNEITVIEPCFWEKGSYEYNCWKTHCEIAEKSYNIILLKTRLAKLQDKIPDIPDQDKLYKGVRVTPEQARLFLPWSLKTELVMTANLREWRHFFDLRCAPAAHPQMREVASMLLREVHSKIPILFDDLYEREAANENGKV